MEFMAAAIVLVLYYFSEEISELLKSAAELKREKARALKLESNKQS